MTVRLLLVGFGGHARSVADVALDLGIAELLFVDDNAQPDEHYEGFPVVRDWPRSLGAGWSMFPASGKSASRREAIARAAELGFAVATVVSRRAYVGRAATIGAGTFVGHGAHIGPSARVGAGCIVNTHAIIEHECVIGDFTHVSVNSVIAGRSRVGRDCFIGAGSTLIDGRSIGDEVVLGAGSVAIEPIAGHGTYVGVPARRTGQR